MAVGGGRVANDAEKIVRLSKAIIEKASADEKSITIAIDAIVRVAIDLDHQVKIVPTPERSPDRQCRRPLEPVAAYFLRFHKKAQRCARAWDYQGTPHANTKKTLQREVRRLRRPKIA